MEAAIAAGGIEAGGAQGDWPRVDSIAAGAYTVPTDQPESDGTLEWDSTTIVIVEVGAGPRAGLGYTYTHSAAAGLIESKLAPIVIDADPMAPRRCSAAMRKAIRNLGAQGIGAMAIAAVDIALWDLRAKLLGISLADSLGRRRDSIPVYGSGGFTSYSLGDIERQLSGWVEAGMEKVKIKVGRDPARDPKRLDAARSAAGDGVELMVDANGAFDRTEAAAWAQRYAEGWDVRYLEEPVPSGDREGLRMLRDGAPPGMRIAAGEYAWGPEELEDLAGCVDVVQADATRCGGVGGLLAADGVCRARRLPFSAHCAPQVSAHVCAAMESAIHIEYFHDHARIESLLFDGALQPHAGSLRPDPSRPGLGIELRRADANRFRA